MKIDVDFTDEEIVAIAFALCAMLERLEILASDKENPTDNETNFYKTIDSAFEKITEFRRKNHDRDLEPKV